MQHVSSREAAVQQRELLILAADFSRWGPFNQIAATLIPPFMSLLLRGGLALTHKQGRSMVRKARMSASQWDSGMPMVPLRPCESGDV